MTTPHERTIRKFNPGTFQSDEEVIEQFVVRKHELQIVTDTLRRNIGARSCQHLLIVAPRGRGKTMLLARGAAEIRTSKDLVDRLIPIRFMEESHEIFTIGDFWMEALFQLARAIRGNHADIAEELSETHADLASQWHSRDVAERVRATVLDTADRLDRHLVVMVENLQSLSSDVDEDFGWSLRQALQTEPKITLLATATSRFKGLDDADEPFYELFRIVHLDPLDTPACGRLMHALTGEERKDIEPLRILTGGDPRLLVLIADFSLHRSFGELMQELVRLIDDHTDYFRSHLDSLPKSERRVYVALIDLWQPSTAGEIAARARMDIRKVSALLGRLVERSAISASGRGNRRYYAATQRLYSIYYKLRREHNEAAIVRSLVQFMVVFYRDEEVADILDQALADGALSPTVARELKGAIAAEKPASEAEAGTTLATSVGGQPSTPDNQLARQLGQIDSPKLNVQAATALLNKGLMQSSLDQPEVAVGTYDELVRRFGHSDDPQLRVSVAMALLNKGQTLGMLDQSEAAVRVCDELVWRFGQSEDPELRVSVATALFYKGVAQGRLSQAEIAIQSYDELMRRFGESDNPQLRVQVAKALLNKGVAQGRLNQPEAAVQVYDELIRRFSRSDDPELNMSVAMALLNKGIARVRLDQPEAAVRAYDELMRRFGESDDPQLRTLVAKALINKGVTLGLLNQPEAAFATYDELMLRFGKSDNPQLRTHAAEALLNKGANQGRLDQLEAAVETYDELLRKFGDSDDLKQSVLVAEALLNKGVNQGRLDKPEAAVRAYDELVRRFGGSDDIQQSVLVAKALLNRGVTEELLDQLEAVVRTYDELVRRFGESDDPQLRVEVARALVNKGVAQGRQQEPEAAVGTYDELARRFGEGDDPQLCVLVAIAILNKGVTQNLLDQPEAAIGTYDELMRRFGGSDDPELRIAVAQTLFNRGLTQDRLHQPEAAAAAYDELVERFGESDDPKLHILVAKALLGKGVIHAHRSELNEMVTVCAAMILQFGGRGEEVSNTTNEMFNFMVDTIASRGAEQAVADLLSQNADTAAALWPFDVALRQFLGEDVRAPAEVMEVAKHVLERIRSAKE